MKEKSKEVEEIVNFQQMIRGVLEEVHPNHYEILNYQNLFFDEDIDNENDYNDGILLLDCLESIKDIETNSFIILIHFPELTISNSLGFSHIIRDLFVGIFIKNGYYVNIGGFRSTKTNKEYLALYNHSHLNTGNTSSFMEFCLGNSSDTNTLANTISNFKNNILTETPFKNFLINLDIYLSWESIEGGPYIFMLDIDYNKEKNLKNSDIRIAINNLSVEFKMELIKNISLVDNYRYNYTEIIINNSKKLTELAPIDATGIAVHEGLYIKKDTFPNTKIEEFLFKTDKFNINRKIIITNEEVQGVDFGEIEMHYDFINLLQNKLTTEYNNILLWKN